MYIQRNNLLTREIEMINMNISDAAYAELDSSWNYKNLTGTVNRIYLVTDGEGEMKEGDKITKLLPGNIYIIPAGTTVSYQCKERLCKLYFHVKLLSSHLIEIPIAKKGCIVLKDRTDTIADIMHLFKNDDYTSAFTIKVYLEQIVKEVMAPLPKQTITNYSSAVANSLRIINTNPHMALTVSAIAKSVSLSPSALQKRFKNEVGIPPSEYIRLQVLAATKKALLNANLSISEISEKYGFCDQFYFSRVFTKQFGSPPSQYRKKHII